jgi:uncharacterized protein YceK
MVGSSAPKPGEAPPIYGGVRVHIKDLSATSDEQAIFAASLDLPLCIVADTFLLPSTVFLNVREAVLKHMATQSPPSDS